MCQPNGDLILRPSEHLLSGYSGAGVDDLEEDSAAGAIEDAIVEAGRHVSTTTEGEDELEDDVDDDDEDESDHEGAADGVLNPPDIIVDGYQVR